MNSNKQNISRLDKIEARQQQLLQRQPDCSRDGIEGQNDSGNDDALHFPAGGMLETGHDKTNAGTDALDLGKLGSERVENMGRLDNRDLPNFAPHTQYSRRAIRSHSEQRNDMRAATKQRSNQSGWLIAPKNFEVSLEEAMELSFRSIIHRASIPNEGADQDSACNRAQNKYPEFNHCSAIEGGRVQNTNRETISPTRPPIALAGVSFTPRDATSIPLSVQTADLSLLGRHSSRALTLGEGISPEIFSPIFSFASIISKNSHRLVSDFDNHSHSKREFAGAQESFEGRNDA